MHKEELFRELSQKISTGEVTREEVASRFNFSIGESSSQPKDPSNFSMNKVMYVLGGIIVVIGVAIFTYQVWEDLGSFSRIMITLGLGLLLTAIGSFLSKKKMGDAIGPVFHVIGGLLVPGGAMVALSELDVSTETLWPITLTFGAIFAFYLLLTFIHRNPALTFFAIGNATVFIYLLVQSIINDSYYSPGDLYAYLTMIIGASYILLALSFRHGWNKPLVGILCFFGSSGFLGAAFSQVFDSDIWRMAYFLLVVGGLFLSAFLRSSVILVVSTLFLLAHVSYITSKYFADSVGWPIALVVLGFIFIGLGYISININRKFIK